MRTVERGEHRVEELGVGIGRVDRGLDLVVDPRHDVGRQQALDDHRAVRVETRVHGIGISVGGEPLDRRRHRSDGSRDWATR